MSVFVDTSAILSVLHADDANHGKAAATFRGMLDRGQALVTSLLRDRDGRHRAAPLRPQSRPVVSC
jgi:predicted nucleic acid-binding protein